MPLLIRLIGDSIHRVISEAFGCLTTLLKSLHQVWLLSEYLTEIINPLMQMLQFGSPFLKECAVNVLVVLVCIPNLFEDKGLYLMKVCSEAIVNFS